MRRILFRIGIALWSVVLLLYFFPINKAVANPGINPNNNITVQNGNVGIGTFTANPNTYVAVYTAPTAGNNFSKLVGLTAVNYDSAAAHWVNCRVVTSASVPGITGFAVGANVGIGTTSVNLLSATNAPGLPVDQWGNPFHYLPAGYTVQCTYETALSNGYVAVDAQAGEF